MPLLKGTSDILSEQEANTLAGFVNKATVRSLERIYSADTNGWSCNNLRSSCAGKTPTIVVIRSADGRKFGVYTPYSWGSFLNRGSYFNDTTNATFIFSLNEPNQQPWKAGFTNASCFQYGLYDTTSYFGFGAGHDLQINVDAKSTSANQSSFSRALNLANNSMQKLEVFAINSISNKMLKEPFVIVDYQFTKDSVNDLKSRVSSASFETIVKKIKGKSAADPQSTVKIKSLNIVLFGGSGVGKSSFVNTLLSSLKGRIVQSQTVRGSTESVSLELTHIPLPNTPVVIWDSMGWDPKSYNTGEVAYVLDGNIPDGFDLRSTPYSQQTGFIHNPDLTQRPHGAGIVIPAILADHEEYIKRVVSFAQYCHQRGIMPFMILTKIDLYDVELTQAGFSCTYHSDLLRDLIDKVAEKTGVNRNQIFPVKNYENEHVLSPEIDALALGALEKIIQFSSDYVSYRMKA